MPLLRSLSAPRSPAALVSLAALVAAGTLLALPGRAQTPLPAPGPAVASPPAALPQAPGSLTVPAGTGTLTGTVTDSDGAMIPGALVRLPPGNAARSPSAETGSDGRFLLLGVPAGAFVLEVTAPGQTPASLHGDLAAGESLEIAPVTLHAAENLSVTVLSAGHDAAEVEVKREETQRLIGVLPNFYVSYDFRAPPLDRRQKWELNWRTITDPVNLALVAGQAGVEQATNAYSGFRQGASGYGKRFGAAYADLAIGNSLGGWIFPVLFKQDPRYFYMGSENGTRKRRFFYALSTSVIARGDNGKWQPAYASLLGDFSAGAASNLYYPAANRQGASLTFENGLLSVAFDSVGNVIQEFVLKHVTPGSGKP